MNFITLAFNPVCRMNEVLRYSSVYQETEESLGEHVAEVSSMSYLIARYLMKNFKELIDIGSLLEKCLLHDVDETLTGDIPRNTKYATHEVHNSLNIVAEESVKTIEGIIGGIEIFEEWEKAKNDKEGMILKIVDMLCVVKKAVTEVELRGNLTFLKVVSELEGHLTRMSEGDHYEMFDKEESKSYLKSLVQEARDEVVTMRVKYNHVVDKFHIRENVIKGV